MVNVRRLVRWVEVILSGAAILTFGSAADAAPVFMASPSARVTTCVPGYQSIAVPSPSAAGATSISGQIVAVNGVQLADPIALVNGTATLPLGLHEVAWSAAASDGTATTLRQALRVEEDASPACCTSGQTLAQGTEAADALVKLLPKPWCVLAAGGPDVVMTGVKVDFISGDDGDDALSSLGGADTMSGGRGADAIVGAAGAVHLYGGPGDDLLDAKLSSSATLFGDEGDDLIFGSPGDDVIVPGPGRDAVTAGAGNDRVEILDISEVESGEILSGGAGTDTLVTPIPLVQLLARGVIVTGFEHIVVDPTRSYLSESNTAGPLVVTATPGPMRIALEWAWFGDAPRPASFDVQRSLNGATGTYTTLASSLTGDSFTDDTLRNGVEVCYRIVATDGGQTPSDTICASADGALTLPIALDVSLFDSATGGATISATVAVTTLPGAEGDGRPNSYALAYSFEITHQAQSPDQAPTRSLSGVVPVTATGAVTLSANWDGRDAAGQPAFEDTYQVNVQRVAMYVGPAGRTCESESECIERGFTLVSGTSCGASTGGMLLLDNDYCPLPFFPDIGPGYTYTYPLTPFPVAWPKVIPQPGGVETLTTRSIGRCPVIPFTDLGYPVRLEGGDLLLLFGDTDPLSLVQEHSVNGARNDDALVRLLYPEAIDTPSLTTPCFGTNLQWFPADGPPIAPIELFDTSGTELSLGPTITPTAAVGFPLDGQVFGIFGQGLEACAGAGSCDLTGSQQNDICDTTVLGGTCAVTLATGAGTTARFLRGAPARLAVWSGTSTRFDETVSAATNSAFKGHFSSPQSAVVVDGPLVAFVYIFGRDKFVGVPGTEAAANLYLMRLTYSHVTRTFTKREYLTGAPAMGVPAQWTEDATGAADALATSLYDETLTIVNQTSVTFDAELGKWVMMYGGRLPNLAIQPLFQEANPTLTREQIVKAPGIVLRTADQPEGPWSYAHTIFNPFWRSATVPGYCDIMYYDQTLTKDYMTPLDCVNLPGLDASNSADEQAGVLSEWGAEYGASIVPLYATSSGGEATLDWFMSTWKPYRVFLMQSKVKILKLP